MLLSTACRKSLFQWWKGSTPQHIVIQLKYTLLYLLSKVPAVSVPTTESEWLVSAKSIRP